MKNISKKISWPAFYVVLLTLFAGWAGDALKGDAIFLWAFELLPVNWRITHLQDQFGGRVFMGLVCLLIAMLFAFRAARLVEGMFDLDCKIDQGNITQSAHMLIFTVSPISRGFEIRIREDGKTVIVQRKNDGNMIEVEMTGNINDDIAKISEKFDKSFSWQQPLRGLRKHLNFSDNRLKKITYIGSVKNNGSFHDIPMLQLLMKPYLQGVDQDESHAVDFLKFDDLRRILLTAVSDAKAAGYRDTDIVLDITGGTKTASIAGAAATLESRVQFQYVDGENNEVFVYQIVGKGKN